MNNDGSKSGDPCKMDNGKLVLKRAKFGGYFYNCSNFPVCRFTMSPNPEEIKASHELALKKREEKAQKAAEQKVKDTEKLKRKQDSEDTYCNCGQVIPTAIKGAWLRKEIPCTNCNKLKMESKAKMEAKMESFEKRLTKILNEQLLLLNN